MSHIIIYSTVRRISPGSAQSGIDYMEISQNFSADKQKEVCMDITIVNDSTAESPENFTVKANLTNLRNPMRLIETSSATVSITDDDSKT